MTESPADHARNECRRLHPAVKMALQSQLATMCEMFSWNRYIPACMSDCVVTNVVTAHTPACHLLACFAAAAVAFVHQHGLLLTCCLTFLTARSFTVHESIVRHSFGYLLRLMRVAHRWLLA